MAETVLLENLAHHVDAASGIETDVEDRLQLMRAEYLEMPRLHLTKRQAQRLWNLDSGLCDALLDMLIDDHFLTKTPSGAYARAEDVFH